MSLAHAQTRVAGPTVARSGLGGPVGGGDSTPAVSWVPATLAAWMLDEASGTRVNAQGDATRDLTLLSGTPSNDVVEKMEGTAALLTTTGQALAAAPVNLGLTSAMTAGCWIRPTSLGTGLTVMRHLDVSPAGLHLSVISTAFGRFTAYMTSGGNASATWTQLAVANSWMHLIGKLESGTARVYRNGVVDGTAAAANPIGPITAQFQIGELGAAFFGPHRRVLCRQHRLPRRRRVPRVLVRATRRAVRVQRSQLRQQGP